MMTRSERIIQGVVEVGVLAWLFSKVYKRYVFSEHIGTLILAVVAIVYAPLAVILWHRLRRCATWPQVFKLTCVTALSLVLSLSLAIRLGVESAFASSAPPKEMLADAIDRGVPPQFRTQWFATQASHVRAERNTMVVVSGLLYLLLRKSWPAMGQIASTGAPR